MKQDYIYEYSSFNREKSDRFGRLESAKTYNPLDYTFIQVIHEKLRFIVLLFARLIGRVAYSSV